MSRKQEREVPIGVLPPSPGLAIQARDTRKQEREILVGVLLGIVLMVVLLAVYVSYRREAARVEWPKRLVELGTTSTNAAPVITALQRYTLATGTPPPTLSALVPTYLTALPTAGAATREADWYYLAQAEGQPPGVWMLGIRVRHNFCPRCPVSFGDWYAYHPNGIYPQKAYGGVLERVGAWGYYHE